LGRFHTRLTHTLRVAQLGRVLATRLGQKDGNDLPDPDIVEAACLAHDIGHPPFGHAGEDELCKGMDRLREDVGSKDGFEGNAQTFRIVTRIASRGGEEHAEGGLNLTRATLRAIVKYPWSRGEHTEETYSKKWSAYFDDKDYLAWVLDGKTRQDRPLEEQIMDWSDDVAYACHDMEDFYRSRIIPLDRLLGSPGKDSREMEKFLEWLANNRRQYDLDSARTALRRLAEFVKVESPYDGSPEMEARLKLSTSHLIGHFMNDITAGGPSLHGYESTLEISDELRFECDLLKLFAWCYVIEGRELRIQQAGQRRIVMDLLDWHFEDQKLLPPYLRGQADPLRAACDYVAGMSERHAHELHRRISGENLGYITDLL
jgi:dGTPase